jgi:RNA ligase
MIIQKTTKDNREMHDNLVDKALDIMDMLAADLKLQYSNENKYNTILASARRLAENGCILNMKHRKTYEDFLMTQHLYRMPYNIYALLHPDVQKEEAVEEELAGMALSMLSDNQLVKYLTLVLVSITWNQNKNLLLMKYNICIYSVGWFDLAKHCRGKIIDINTRDIISYPFDKFFNLNEMPESNIEVIQPKIDRAKYVCTTEKKDGSTIIISRHNGNLLVTTNGSFENEHISLAMEILAYHEEFCKQCLDDMTYIFELIHPQKRIILDYGQEKALYLLNIRNLKTGMLMPIEYVHSQAARWHFPVPKYYDFSNLNDFIELAHKLQNANQEGWVFRIEDDGTETMLKLKLDEYFAMHRMMGDVSLWLVYRLFAENQLDDYMVANNEDQKVKIQAKIAQIEAVQQEIIACTLNDANIFLKKHTMALDTFLSDRAEMISAISEIQHDKDIQYPSQVIQYLKGGSLEESVCRIRLPAFKNIVRRFHPNWCPGTQK